MKTSLFNLHEIEVEGEKVLIEFYAGDIMDIPSDILLLSAYKDNYFPVPGTTWGSLHEKTGINVCKESSEKIKLSENISFFNIPGNNYFNKLTSFEFKNIFKPQKFTLGTLKNRYNELVSYLENQPTEDDESISMPLLGTGNQGLSLEESVTELLDTFKKIKKTKLKIIRVFAWDFESIGVLNKKINEQLKRTEIIPTSLLTEAMNEARKMLRGQITSLSFETITDLISLNDFDHAAYFSFGIKGRIFAQRVCDELLRMYAIELEPSTLHAKISGLAEKLRKDCPPAESHLRLLQTYGNLAAHGIGDRLNHQDAASIVIAILRVAAFYEFKYSGSVVQPEINTDNECT